VPTTHAAFQPRPVTPSLPRLPQVLRLAAALLCAGASACDAPPEPTTALAQPCDLADEDCGAHPHAADAVMLLEAMGIDADDAEVELRERPPLASIDTLESTAPAAKPGWSCNSNDTCSCCCTWGGATWGCGCDCG